MQKNLILLTNTASPIWQRSIGAYQVASHCRQNGFSCQIIDFTDYFTEDELYNILQNFIGPETLAIGVSTTFYFTAGSKEKYISPDRSLDSEVIPEYIKSLLARLKREHKLKIIAGGANSHRIKSDALFDTVIHGYSEQTVVNYLNSLKSGKRTIYPKIGNTEYIDGSVDHFNIETLDHRWDESDCVLEGETLPIEISRGCIFKCKFCSYPLNGKKKFDYLRDPDRIKQELIYNYENFKTTNYFFTDDTFNDSTFKLEQLHRVITELPFKIKFVTYLRLDLLYAHPEQINMLYEMGLGSAFFGIESFNPESSKLIGKGMDPDKIKSFLYELHDVHWKREIPLTCSFIVGLPGESIEKLIESHEWCKSAPINDLWFPLFIKTDSYYKSEFDINYTDYGYTLDQDGTWSNEHMDFNSAVELSERFNKESLYSTKNPSSWYLFGLLNYGLSISDLKDTPVQNISKFSMARKHQRLIVQYKKLLNDRLTVFLT